MAPSQGCIRVTPYLCARGAAQAIEFYKAAFGAVEQFRMDGPDGKLGHAEILIGDTVVQISDEYLEHGAVSPLASEGNSVSFVIDYRGDVDAAYRRAVELGAVITRAVEDQPWGRGGWLKDPFGHRWSLLRPNPKSAGEDGNR